MSAKSLTRLDLRPFQNRFVRLLHKKGSLIVALDMGGGKTAITLTYIRDLFDQQAIRKVLVVAPLLVAETVWPEEIARWSHTRPLSYKFIRGTPDEMRKQLKSQARIHIINKERVQWLHEEIKTWPGFKSGDIGYDVLVIDEASMLKNGKKKVKASQKHMTAAGQKSARPLSRFGALADMRTCFQHIVELTGTPTPKGLENLWGLMYVIDGGERLGLHKSGFEKKYFTKNMYTWQLVPKPGAEKEIFDKISDVLYSLDPADYMQMPEVVDNEIHLSMPAALMKKYRQFERDLYSEEYDVTAVSSGVAANKLCQFASGSMYRSKDEAVFIHDIKLDALDNLVQELDGNPLLVATSYKFDVDRIRTRFKKAVILNEETDIALAKARWDAGDTPLLVGHRASLSHGLNLQYGGHNMCQYGFTFDAELYAQFNKRLPRPGQTKTVFNHLLIMKNTRDEDSIANVTEKLKTQSRILAATDLKHLRDGKRNRK